jgi:hypothetical protein
MLSILTAMMVLSSITACTGSRIIGAASQAETRITAGSYFFTVTGSGSPVVSPMPSTTLTLTVN